MKIFEYGADAGTCVINGIGFNNGVGDGGYGVYYEEELPNGAKFVEDIWIDLRNGYDIVIHGYDCNKKGEEYEPNLVIKAEQFTKYFNDAKALHVAVNKKTGNIYLVKYF